MSLRFIGSRDGRRPAPWRQPRRNRRQIELQAIAVAGCQCLPGALEPELLPYPLVAIRDYPDRGQTTLRQAMAGLHGLDPDAVLPGNGAAELFTWAARDAAAIGVSGLISPGFADAGGLCSAGRLRGLTSPWR